MIEFGTSGSLADQILMEHGDRHGDRQSHLVHLRTCNQSAGLRRAGNSISFDSKDCLAKPGFIEALQVEGFKLMQGAAGIGPRYVR